MKLFKNVDIADLKSILARGILSMDESGNNNLKMFTTKFELKD